MDLVSKAENLINSSTMHTVDESGTADWVMALTDIDGYPVTSMITASKADGFKWISFCTGFGDGSNKTKRIEKDPRASFYLFDKETFTGISLIGKVEIITNIELKKQMWYDALGEYFKSAEDANWCVIMFRPERYNIFIDYQVIHGTV
jgi:general stress protein 26